MLGTSLYVDVTLVEWLLMGRPHEQQRQRSLATLSAVFAVGNRIALFVASGATGAVLARLLSQSELGVFFTAFSLAMIIQALADLGSSSVAMRELAHGDNRPSGVVPSALRLSAIGLSATAVVVFSPLGSWLLTQLGFESSLEFRVLLLGLIATLLAQRLSGDILRGLGAIALATFYIGSASRIIAVVVFGVMLGLGYEVGVQLVILVHILSVLSICGCSIAVIRRRLTSRPVPSRRSVLRLGHTYWILAHAVLWNVLQEGDIVLAGGILGSEQAAEYAVAWRVVSLVTMPLQALNMIVIPHVAAALRDDRGEQISRRLTKAVGLSTLAAGLMCAVILVYGRTILGVWFGGQYTTAYWPLVAMSLGQLFVVAAGPGANVLVAAGEDRRLVGGSVLGVATMVALGLPLGLHFGSTGLAAGSAVGLCVASLCWASGAARKLRLRTDGLALVRTWTANNTRRSPDSAAASHASDGSSDTSVETAYRDGR